MVYVEVYVVAVRGSNLGKEVCIFFVRYTQLTAESERLDRL